MERDSMRLSAHFTVYDLEFDMYARKNKIENIAPTAVIQAAEDVAQHILEPLVDAGFRFNIASWYRSAALEREYCKTSFLEWSHGNNRNYTQNNWVEYLTGKQHMLGTAVAISGGPLAEIYEFLRQLRFDTLQMRDGYIYVSYVDGANRGLILE